jgi:hypothetical protein
VPSHPGGGAPWSQVYSVEGKYTTGERGCQNLTKRRFRCII